MKIFKKAISLVLVFAMLASFAGMTGFEASAFRTTFTTAGGIKVEMAPTLYKTKATTAGVINWDNHPNEVGDYVILAADNDLEYYFTFPEWVKTFQGGLSAKPNTDPTQYHYLWGDLEYRNWHNKPDDPSVCWFNRSGGSAQNNDYGVLFGRIDDTAGYENGFENVDTIYWVVRYSDYESTVEDDPSTTGVNERAADIARNAEWHYDTWSIPLVALEDKSNTPGKTDTSAKNNATAGDGSGAGYPAGHDDADYAARGCNMRKFTVPTTLYTTDGSTLINKVGNTDLKGVIYAQVPQWAKNIRLYVVKADGSEKQLWNYTGLDPSNPKGNPYGLEVLEDPDINNTIKDETDYYVIQVDVLANDLGIKGTSGYISTHNNKKCVLYRIEYDCNRVLSNGYEQVDNLVTSVQYAASYVSTVPVYKLATGSTPKTCNYDNWTFFNKKEDRNYIMLPFYQNFNFESLLSANGVAMQATVGGSPGKITYHNGSSNGTPANIVASRSITANTLDGGMQYWDEKTLYASYSPDRAGSNKKTVQEAYWWKLGVNRTSDSSSNTSTAMVGMKFYVDVQSVDRTINYTVPVYSEVVPTAKVTDFSWGNPEDGSSKVILGMTKTGCWANFQTSKALGSAWSIPTASSTYDHIYYASGEIGWEAAKHKVTDNTNVNFGGQSKKDNPLTIKGSFFGENNQILLINRYFAEANDLSVPAAKMDVDCALYLAYHFQTELVNRENSHTIINNAMLSAYVQAEMDPTWWNNYKNEVITAYIALGDLQSTEPTYTKHVDSPDYLIADYSKLGAALEAVKTEIDLDTSDSYSGANCSYYYTTASWNQFLKTLGEAARVYLGNEVDTDYKFDINYTTQTSDTGPACYKQEMIDLMTDAVKRAKSVLKKYADYSELLERLNGTDDLPDYDKGSSTQIGSFDGSQWYTAETWNNFVSKRNALVALTGNGGTFNVNTGISNNYTRGSLTEGDQGLIDNAVAAFDAAKSALKLKTMSEYKNTSGTDYNTLINQVNTNFASLSESVPVYTIVNGQLDKTSKTVNIYDTAELEAARTQVLAIAATDSLAANYTTFESLLTAYNNVYVNTLSKTNPADRSGWQGIFDQLTANVNDPSVTITQDNLLANFNEYYVDTNVGSDGKGDKYKAIEAIFTQYNGTINITTARDAQAAINVQVEALYNALNVNMPSKFIADAVTRASNTGAGTFTVYNPYNLSQYKDKHSLYAAFGDTTYDGIVKFNTYTPESVSILTTAINNAASNNSYNMLTTKIADITSVADTLLAKAGLKTVAGVACVLEAESAKLDILAGALTGAKTALDMANVEANYYTDPTKNISYSRYTAKSREELRAVYNLALEYYNTHATETEVDGQKVITTTLSADNQLEIDKLVFQLLDEIEDTRNLVSATDIAVPHWTWTYYDADGAVTTDESKIASAKFTAENNDVFTAEKWDELLHEAITTTGLDNGLASNNAVYSLLELETKTPKIGDENIGVWDADGNIVSTTVEVAGNPIEVEVGAGMYTNWSAYKEALKAATDLLAEYNNGNGTVLTSDKQDSHIDTVTKALYDAREALEYNNFSGHPNYQEAVNFYNNNVNRFKQTVNVFEYSVNADKSGTTKSDPIPVNIFKDKAIAQAEAILAEFYAKWVGSAQAGPTDRNSDEAYENMIAAQAPLVEALNALAVNTEYVKLMNDPEFLVGWNDLNESFIPANYADLLSNTDDNNQVAALAEKISAASTLITKNPATVDAVNTLITKVDDLYIYTSQTPATNLQFAAAMRKQLVEFLQLQFNLPTLTFYTNSPSKLYAFNQEQAREFINLIDGFLGTSANWPLIYEVNNLEVVQDTTPNSATYGVYNVKVWPSKTTVTNDDGLTTNVSSGTGADKKIDDIFAQIGAQSTYYKQILLYTNSYYVDQLDWIVKNMFVEVNGEKLILADLNGEADGSTQPYTDSLGNNITINYDVKKTAQGQRWYSEGYGYHTADNGRVYYLYNSNRTIYGSINGSWFDDKTVNALQTQLSGGAYAAMQQRLGTKDYTTIGKIQDNAVTTTNLTRYQLSQIETKGWSQKRQTDLFNQLNADQMAIYNAAYMIYSNICNLKLLPATEEYRDVYNTYLSVKGQHIADGNWLEGSFSHAKTDENNKEIIDAVDYTFYNMDPNFIGKTNLSKEQGEYTTYDTTPPYGVVFRSSNYNLWGKYKQAGEYVGTDHMAALEEFINDFINKGAVITIDQAAKVNTYGEIDGERTIKKILIDDYLSKLQLKDFVFTNLDMVIKAFLGNRLQADLVDNMDNAKILNEELKLPVNSSYGRFYDLSFYTDASLLEVAKGLRQANVLKDDVVKFDTASNSYIWTKNPVTETINYNEEMWGSFYTSVSVQTQIDGNESSVLKNLIEDLNTELVLKDVDISGIKKAVEDAENIIKNQAKYDTKHTRWNEFITAKEAAETIYSNEAYKNYNITHQQLFDDKTSALLTAILNLKEALLADNYAPSMTLKTSVSAVKEFYGKEAYAVALSKADSVSYTVTEADGKTNYDAHPEAGTFFVPNSSGYSLIVYTNELNPRIVINLEDIEQVLEEGTNGSANVMQDAAKQEYIAIQAKRTSGVTTNVIAGTIIPAQGSTAEQMKIIGQTADATGAVEATANNEVTVTNGSDVKGSSAFAILAPIFKSDKTTQAAVYTIEARDGSQRTVDGGTVYGNQADKFDFGDNQNPIDIARDNNGKIAIYVYYYGLKAEDGTEEGINADGTALATPAISGTHVPSALLSGEPGFKGTDWRNGILLQRHFSDSHRVWEYVSEIKQNEKKQYNVNGTQVPLYNDPTFGQLNTGSFYYVLDESVAADAEVIAAYSTDNNAVAGCMDYDRATAAKDLMISKINEKDSTVFAAMKKSGRFYNYGDYYTDDNGKVLTYDNGEPQWVNWAQSLNNKVENGDLVFVHVVDRWGNVVNRIVEITNLDKKAPQVNSATSGEVSINEAGGSGIKDITVHNGDFSLGKFDYEINQSQKLTNGQVANNATVESANDTLTIKGLVPGKLYYIGAYDNAGNAGSKPVNASSDGKITLTITVEDDRVETGEENGVTPNSTTFTLNGTDTIILNSGEASSVINADIEGNVFANRLIKHLITTLDTVTGLKTVYQDGTVEEWTSSNARVKDNGDGTLTWTIGRNFAEGEHNYKVYAKVDGEYEKFYAPANFFATNKSVRITYRVSGPGNTVLVYGGASGINNPNYNSLTVPYGSKVTITAETNIEGCEFYYWINNTTDRIISTANVLEFKAVANVDYIAQFTNNSTYTDGKKFVVYVNNAKNVIERFELADGDSYTVPTGPVLPDYTFMGWSMTKAEVLESDKDTIIVEPIYELNASNTVTITEGNYTATGAGTYTAQDNQRAVVTISTSAKDGDGKEFLYWLDADTDEIISYDRTYSFFCVKDTELTPVYGDASTITAEPIVRITEVKFNALSGKVSFFAERSVPEEFVILQTGIVVTKTESIGTNEEVFVVGGTSTAAGTSTSTANNGYYSANTAVATGQTVWARAYVIYETADGEIFEAYGPVVSYTVD